MKTLMVVFVLLLVGIAGLGFYRGWFRLSTDNTDHKPSATIMVDQDKIQKDEQWAKEEVQSVGHGAEEKADEPAHQDKEQESRP